MRNLKRNLNKKRNKKNYKKNFIMLKKEKNNLKMIIHK